MAGKSTKDEGLEAALARLQDYERIARENNQVGLAMTAVEKQARLLRFEMS
jgi:hypothetical protein